MQYPLIVRQFLVLLWKNNLLRKRHWILTALEVILPLLISCIALLHNSGENQAQLEQPTRAKTVSNLMPDLDPEKRYLYYAPKNEFTEMIFQAIELPPVTIFGVKTEEELDKLVQSDIPQSLEDLDKIIQDQDRNKTIGGIVFEDYLDGKNPRDTVKVGNVNFPKRLKISIRSAGVRLPQPAYLKKQDLGPNSHGDHYIRQQFLTLQLLVTQAYIRLLGSEGGKTIEELDELIPPVEEFKAVKFPYPRWVRHPRFTPSFLSALFPGTAKVKLIQLNMEYCVVIGFLIILLMTVKRVVDEKVIKAKDLLRLMRLKDTVYYGSHFANALLIMIPQCVILTIMFSVIGGSLLQHCAPSLLFAILVLYCVASVTFALFLSCFFQSPVKGIVIACLIWVGTSEVFGYLFIKQAGLTETTGFIPADEWFHLLLCLFPNYALKIVNDLLIECDVYASVAQFQPENEVYRATWGNIFNVLPFYESITIGNIMGMMILSCSITIMLIWYVDAVWPWQDSQPKPWYFPFTKSYWLGTDAFDEMDSKEFLPYDPVDNTLKNGSLRNNLFEEEPRSLKRGVEIKNLKKQFTFGNEKKMAVNDVNLNLYYGQITVLLGHNGAGKTTLISMLTGLHKPSSGKINIDGYDALTQPNLARNSMGLCPQYDVLYDGLTTEEHLRMFGVIKGYTWEMMDAEVKHVLKLINLTEKREVLSKNLSGGMQRRLSLGIAMVAGSKILVLDEPSSGLDPEARRGIWDFLLNVRNDRLILLTTHHMEEADALGDRVAIMSSGQVKCCGTTIFLKRAFGAGYHLRIAKVQGKWKPDQFKTFMSQYLPEALQEGDNQGEILYTIDTAYCKKFPQFFEEFEKQKESFGASSCGVNVSSMDDVFLKVGLKFDHPTSARVKSSGPIKNGGIYGEMDSKSSNHISRNVQRFKALFLKRVWEAKRNSLVISFILTLAVGSFLALLGILHATFANRNGTPVWSSEVSFKGLGYDTDSIGFYTISPKLRDEEAREKALEFIKKYYIPAAKRAGVAEIVHLDDPGQTLLNESYRDALRFREKFLVGLEYSKRGQWMPWWQSEASHVLPISFNILFNAFLDRIKEEVAPDVDLMTIELDMKVYKQLDIISGLIAFLGRIFSSVFVPFSIAFISAYFATFPTAERVNKAKLLQLMTGVSVELFWAAHFVFDLILYFTYCILIVVIYLMWNSMIYYFGVFFVTPETSVAFMMLLVLFGMSGIPFAYLFSFYVKRPSTSFGFVCISCLLLGLVSAVSITFYEVAREDHASESEKLVWAALIWGLRIIPHVSLTLGLLKLFSLDATRTVCSRVSEKTLEFACPLVPQFSKQHEELRMFKVQRCCKVECQENDECFFGHPFKWSNWLGVNEELLMLFAMGLIYWGIILLIEHSKKIKGEVKGKGKSLLAPLGLVTKKVIIPKPVEDKDVLEEKKRTHRIYEEKKFTDHSMVIYNLTKRYGNHFVATDHLNFAVEKMEIFGLLGINGAGKTTAFKMLTGDLNVSEGNAWINQYDLKNRFKHFRQQIGYCPQFDALIGKLNAYEQLSLFARLRGIPEEKLDLAIQGMIEMVDLTKHAHGPSENYSGGNRRKLSLGVACIAGPSVIFLDEPTSGVDPGARRKIWVALKDLQDVYHCAIVLTSHSMDECEALCDRLAIMVSGQFRCLGSTQDLRGKFCQGYTLILKFKYEQVLSSQDYVLRVRDWVDKHFPDAFLRDVHETLLYYHVPPSKELTWSTMFEMLEEARTQFDLDDYQLSDTSLEQIFLSFARVAKERAAAEKKRKLLQKANQVDVIHA